MDDVKDAKSREAIVKNQKRIREGFLGYSFDFNDDIHLSKRESVSAFIALMEKDIELTKSEIAEDKIERAEDRRETRDDRRDRKRRRD